MGKVVGIDLGTSNSVVSAVIGGTPVVIPDEEGNRIQPSIVSFLPGGEVVVGHKARARKVIDPLNTVYSIKRLIGRPFYSEQVRVAQSHYPYQVVCGSDNNPKVFVQGQEFSPEEVSAMVLRRMKQIAERHLGQTVDRAIITVPANFNEAQRYATKAAGEIAGLDVLRILNEPTAAALAYGYGHNKRETVAIYDFGGGTFDITILSLRGSVFEVLSTAGDTYLGGDDFDNRLVDYMVAAFQHKHGYDLGSEIVALQRLRNIAERLKCELSEKDKVAVHIKEIIPGSVTPVMLSFSISREGFNDRCGDIVKRTFVVCDEAMRLARMTTSQVDHVVLVGGTTRVPMVAGMVAQYFSKPPVDNVNPDEVVAVGAAIYASSLDEQFYAPPALPETVKREAVAGDGDWSKVPSFDGEIIYEDEARAFDPPSYGGGQALLIDVTPRGLGVATAGGFCDVIIERNENIPTERRRTFGTSRDNQDQVRIQILEGESRQANENRKLGELLLTGIRPAFRGDVRIEVIFELDTSGILNATAIDKETGRKQSARLQLHGNMDDDEIRRLAERQQRTTILDDLPEYLP
jgi:molecular chaperone DnaK